MASIAVMDLMAFMVSIAMMADGVYSANGGDDVFDGDGKKKKEIARLRILIEILFQKFFFYLKKIRMTQFRELR